MKQSKQRNLGGGRGGGVRTHAGQRCEGGSRGNKGVGPAPLLARSFKANAGSRSLEEISPVPRTRCLNHVMSTPFRRVTASGICPSNGQEPG